MPRVIAIIALGAACNAGEPDYRFSMGDPSGSETAGDSSSTGGSQATDTQGSASGTAQGSETDTGKVAEDWGAVSLELRPAASASSLALTGVSFLEVVVFYDQCGATFLRDNPELAYEGTDGAAVFEEWTARLCQDPVAKGIACTVADVGSFVQKIAEAPEDDSYLRIEYQIDPTHDLEGGVVLAGPLPTELLTGCATQVELRASNLVAAKNDTGAKLWGSVAVSDVVAAIGVGDPVLAEVAAP